MARIVQAGGHGSERKTDAAVGVEHGCADIVVAAAIVAGPGHHEAAIGKRRDIGLIMVGIGGGDGEERTGPAVGIEEAPADIAARVGQPVGIGHHEAAVGQSRDAGLVLRERHGFAGGELVRQRRAAGAERTPRDPAVAAGAGRPQTDVARSGRIACDGGLPLRSVGINVGKRMGERGEVV